MEGASDPLHGRRRRPAGVVFGVVNLCLDLRARTSGRDAEEQFRLSQRAIFGDYQVGLEILALNGALMFAGLWLISKRRA